MRETAGHKQVLTFKYRLKDRTAKKALARHARAVNLVWNYCVAYQRDIEMRYRAGAPKRKWPGHFDLTYRTVGVGKELGISQGTVGEICRVFAQSRNATRHSPKFRRSFGSRRSLGWIPFRDYSRQIDGNSVTYKRKTYRWFSGKRALPDTAKGGCFVEDARGRWYVCFYAEVEVERQRGSASIGIDLGLKSFAAISDGRHIEAPQPFRSLEHKLVIAQRAGNKKRAATIHGKIKNSRADFLHKLSSQLVSECEQIAIGDVSSSKLAKTRFAKSVLDAGWSMFRTQLRYKCQQAGVAFLDVDEAFTTQACSSCGTIPNSSPKGMDALGIRRWECSECGASHDRDVNAARNILIAALSAQRLDGESRLVTDRHDPLSVSNHGHARPQQSEDSP